MRAAGATLVVLTGGRSSRMGVDKALLDAGGVPLAARPALALAALCDEVVLAGRAVPGVAGRVVPDAPGAEGPLAGIVAGLRAASRDLCVVAACDMPTIEPGLVALLLDALEQDPALDVAVCAGAGGRLEPLPFAARRAAAVGRLETAVEAGVRSINGALEAALAGVVPARAWRQVDPDGATFASWNTPSDVRELPPLRPPPGSCG
ncbi:MAG TPA: molybdenum cofactor guanylyltransferase [Candidatus Dormibacteraeota bacterium]|nr:molybdenum cofactor guanylyltransferase [Candidatus Dormibacteraeota bacterium]